MCESATIYYRDLWGLARDKRAALLEDKVPYQAFSPSQVRRWKLVPYDTVGGYEDWPALDELFPTAYQGVNHNRGIEGSLIAMDRDELALRMNDYYSSLPWDQFALRYPELAKDRARYSARETRDFLNAKVGEPPKPRSTFDPDRLVKYVLCPLDARFIYYETEAKLLNERRPELWENYRCNELLVTVPEPRQVSESRPLLATSLFDLHLHDRGSVAFPAQHRVCDEDRHLFNEGSESAAVANFATPAWCVLRDGYGLDGDLPAEDAKTLVRRLFRLALALGHAPQFEQDHRESLAQDWMHLPIPKDRTLLAELAKAGDKVAILLNPLTDPRPALREILSDSQKTLAVLGTTADRPDYTVSYSYFGGGKGRWESRPAPADEWPTVWGEQTGDLYLNPTTFLRNIPERIWRYELGGYPVIKKWLGYRDAKRRPGKPLTQDELAHLRSIVHRISALHLLHPRLDALYERIGDNAFTADELGLRTSV